MIKLFFLDVGNNEVFEKEEGKEAEDFVENYAHPERLSVVDKKGC